MKSRLIRTSFIQLILLAVLPGVPFQLAASDEEAVKLYDEGRQLYLQGEYHDASEKFEECHLNAKSSVIRANSLLARIGAYRMCKLYYKEFEAIEELLEKHPDFADYKAMIAREFEIGDLFQSGHRDPAFWSLRSLPWLDGPDHTEEIYTKALKRSPFAEQAPGALLRLAFYYEMEGKSRDSLDTLRKILKNHAGALESKYALLALGNGLFEVAKHGGDGDGSIIREALGCFNRFIEQHPDAPEVPFARRKIAQSRDIQAERIYQMAEYYRKNGRSEVANRYLAKIVRNFPESRSAAAAEKELAAADRTYLPGDFPEVSEPRLAPVHAYTIPEEAEEVLISPLAPGHHYLLPVPDLKNGKPAPGTGEAGEAEEAEEAEEGEE